MSDFPVEELLNEFDAWLREYPRSLDAFNHFIIAHNYEGRVDRLPPSDLFLLLQFVGVGK
jgi:hypothetical protein